MPADRGSGYSLPIGHGRSAPIPAAQVRSADARKRTLLSDMMMAGLGGKLPVLFGERSPDCGHPCQGASGRILNNSAVTPILPPKVVMAKGPTPTS
jgi:hypothetical protein